MSMLPPMEEVEEPLLEDLDERVEDFVEQQIVKGREKDERILGL